MIECVGQPPNSQESHNGVAMETMHFHIAHTKSSLGDFSSHSEDPTEQFSMHLKSPRSAG